MADTSIEWADKVWNPVTGCTKVSEGCRNCYAERIAKRFWNGRKFGDIQCHPDRLDAPFHWKKPAKIFVNSMSDLFHEEVSDWFIDQVFNVAIHNPQHVFIILTKRPIKMLCCAPLVAANNVWLGVSVENQQAADERIPLLLQTPAAIRFVSVEPMLSRISLPLPGIDWVICGGESGANARPHPSLEDVRFLKDQCVSERVPFFLKQMWGKKMPEIDGQTWNQFPGGK
jgi:protein gp37